MYLDQLCVIARIVQEVTHNVPYISFVLLLGLPWRPHTMYPISAMGYC